MRSLINRESNRSPSADPPSYDASMSSSSSSLVEHPPPIVRQSSSHILRSQNQTPKSPPLRPATPRLLSFTGTSHSVSSSSNSSSGISNSTNTGIKNVPYRPSSELQKHIDKTLNATVSPLNLVVSNTQTEYFDILPSFQMFQSILKRDNSQFSENLSVEPPVYGDTKNSVPSPPPLSRNGSFTGTSASTQPQSQSQSRNEYFYQQQRDNESSAVAGDDFIQNLLERFNNLSGPSSSQGRLDNDDEYNENEHERHSSVSASHDTYGHTVLDNIDKLPKKYNSPIDIQIHVTKRVPVPHVANEMETRLKEYSSGDMVNGYITIFNTSDKPVDFGLFIVTLEGTVKAIQRVNNPNSLDNGKIRRLLMKKFLKMYDFNASYGYGKIPSSAGVEYDFLSHDANDGSIFGLPDERILQPQQKYKKFFTFKFPEKLLDNSCINSVLPHVLAPPSFGFDRTCFYNKGSAVELNKALGYGFLNVRGTPLLTKDYAFDDVSVSYTIEAKFIDKLNDKAKDPLSHQDINDDLNADINDYVISGSCQYFLRFIPDIKKSLEYYNIDNTIIGYDTFSSVGIDGILFQNYLNLVTWKQVHKLNKDVELAISSRLDRDEISESDVKHKNLFLHNTDQNSDTAKRFNIKQQILSQLEFHRTTQLDIDDNLYYHDDKMIGSVDSVAVLGKKKKKLLSVTVNIGSLKLFVRIPDKPFPYSSPKLLMKYNNQDGSANASPVLSPMTSHELGTHKSSSQNLNSFAKIALSPTHSNSIDGNLALTPVSSVGSTHMMELYHRDSESIQDHIDLVLVFNPNENSVQPPKISHIETNIVAWTWNSEYPLPFPIRYDFFYCSPESEKLHSNLDCTRENLQRLKDSSFNYLHFLKENNVDISKESFLYLKSLQTLSFKKDTIKDYYQPLTSSSHSDLLNNENDWKAKQSINNPQHLLWSKSIKLPLIPTLKSNINLIPSFLSCLVGRMYCLQIVVKYKGGSDHKDSLENTLRMEVPILIG